MKSEENSPEVTTKHLSWRNDQERLPELLPWLHEATMATCFEPQDHVEAKIDESLHTEQCHLVQNLGSIYCGLLQAV
jgi:hypothetical protein